MLVSRENRVREAAWIIRHNAGLSDASLAELLADAAMRWRRGDIVAGSLELSGRQFGRLFVARKADQRTRGGHVAWRCICDCARVVLVISSNLTRGHTRSCGCLELDHPNGLRNGHFRNGRQSPEYRAWLAMKSRCSGSESRYRSTHLYFGRGIRVCDRWKKSFPQFLEDMGLRPSAGHSLDRIKTDGNYEPANCRWATLEQQANNKRTNVYIDVDGRRMTAAQWSRVSGVKASSIRRRIRAGWNPDSAVWTTAGKITRWNSGTVRRENS